MTIQDRIKKIRKDSGYNQADFGKRLGLSESAICNYESGRRSISEQTIKSICREFHVNYAWLKDGEGPEKDSSGTDIVLKTLKETYHLDELDTQIVQAYLQLSDKEKEAFKAFVEKLKGTL